MAFKMSDITQSGAGAVFPPETKLKGVEQFVFIDESDYIVDYFKNFGKYWDDADGSVVINTNATIDNLRKSRC